MTGERQGLKRCEDPVPSSWDHRCVRCCDVRVAGKGRPVLYAMPRTHHLLLTVRP